ncbi:serine protease family protein [[Muricauda] lutisoli]|uniref:Serine protease n=1 Tax=[Muricauda] lutisoli TaxID=2816035 RepID=A0ABS3F006_9FLAO|nr:hypothetical protein [[Muricauda] lutisoli]MBO0331734.1 hypothetical protein [[Muricauda] lutisoli]
MKPIFKSACYFTFLICFAQGSGQKQKNDSIITTNQILESIVMIKESLYSKKTGTGVLMVNNDEYYLVTAEHIKAITNSNSYISLGSIEKDTFNIPIIKLIKNKLVPLWRTHDKADLSILKLSNHKKVLDTIKHRFLDSKYFMQKIPDSTINNNNLYYTVGFPLGYGISPNFNPLIKASRLASNNVFIKNSKDIYGNNDVFNGKSLIHILLQDPSIGGFSGGPVFYSGGAFNNTLVFGSTTPKCVGIVSGTVGDSTGGKMAIITPAHLIFDLTYD